MKGIPRLIAVNAFSVTLAAMLCTLALFVARIDVLEFLELRTYDLRLLSRGPLEPHPAIALALIDESSLDSEGRWPWPRSRIAALVDRLSESGARVIAFDIGFLEPDTNSGISLIDELAVQIDSFELRDPKLDSLLAARRELADTDRTLANAIARSQADVVLGYFFHENEATAPAISASELDEQLGRIERSQYETIRFERQLAKSPFDRAFSPEGNLAMLAEAAASSGTFTLRQDPDGIVRWMPLAIESGPLEEVFPPIAVLAAWHYLGEPPMTVRVDAFGVVGVEMGERFIPTDEHGRLLINYTGPPGSYPHLSAGDILAGTVAAEQIRDRVVIVGATATGTYDMRSTPFNTVFPGVEIHATVVDNILSERFLTRADWADVYDIAAILVLCALAGLLLPRVGALGGGLLTLVLLCLHVVVAREVFVRVGVPIGVAYPVMGLLLSYVGLTGYFFLSEQRERRKVQGTFGQYVSPVIVEQIIADPEKLKLGGEEKVLSVLFSDLQGFTAYSERYTPQQMIEILSEYYARMTEAVFDHGGMLKEYVGDELMAIFGAPVEQADHADRTCHAALAMQRRRHRMTEEWLKIGRPALIARTGVNSGEMLVGNLGSEYRFAYGVMGDDVNLGSRLEGMCKQYACEIIIGQNTRELLRDTFVLRELDQVRVVGKQKPTQIFELLGEAGESSDPDSDKALAAYASGLEAYRAQHWNDARALFDECRRYWPEDGPAKVMAERCIGYASSPMPEDWDGVYEATKK